MLQMQPNVYIHAQYLLVLSEKVLRFGALEATPRGFQALTQKL